MPTRIPRCCSFQTSYVGAVSEFRLRITSDILVLFRFLEEQFVLFRSTLVSQSYLYLYQRLGLRRIMKVDPLTKNMLTCKP